MSKKVLVIGGAGFIGMNIVKTLGQKGGYDITIGDNFFRGKMDESLSSIVNDYNVKVVSADFSVSTAFEELDTDL